jgi:hypothetical protein
MFDVRQNESLVGELLCLPMATTLPVMHGKVRHFAEAAWEKG